jgi:YbgC/YbaW family acyl-CoA thioester hydrolase
MPGEVFVHRQRVIYAQCTIGNHVYHSRYLDIMEAARGEFMRAIGYPLQRLQDEDCIFPVISLRMKFIAPARYDDELQIHIDEETFRWRVTEIYDQWWNAIRRAVEQDESIPSL